MTFVGEDGELDVDAFRYGCQVTITAQEILVDNASYPTPKIERTATASGRLAWATRISAPC